MEKKIKKIKKIGNFRTDSVGAVLFLVGLLVSIIAAFMTLSNTQVKIVSGTLILISIAIGILNITKDETVPFLLSSLVILLLGAPLFLVITQVFIKSNVLTLLYTNLLFLFVPAAFVVALKTILITAKDEE